MPAPKSWAASSRPTADQLRHAANSRAAARALTPVDGQRVDGERRGGARRTTKHGSSRCSCRARLEHERGHCLAGQAPARRRDRHQRRRQLRLLGAPLLPIYAAFAPSSRRPAAPWATACRPASRPSSSHPDRTVIVVRRRRRLPDERPGARDRRAVRRQRRFSSWSTTACTAPSACTRKSTIRPRERHEPRQSRLRRARARLRLHGETVEKTADFEAAFERAWNAKTAALLEFASIRMPYRRARRCRLSARKR